MRFSRLHAVSASTFLTTSLLLSSLVSANPYPRLASSSPDLEIRACANPCGWQGQLCCEADEHCYTDSNNQAQCGAGTATSAAAAAAGGATVTVTVYGGSATAATCNVQLGQSQCGSTCCSLGQFCNNGYCMNNGATTGGVPAVATATVSAAIRPTSISTFTVFTTNGATSTVPFLMPAAATATSSGAVAAGSTSTSGSSLSGGAIAGIVIGVIAGIILLILLIICCCARGLLDLFRPNRKHEITETYESHHHAAGVPPKRRFGIFGGGNGGRVEEKHSSDKKKGLLGVAGILAAVAIFLGLKRRRDERNAEKESTVYTYSDYTYDYSTSASSESSDDRRTRATRSDRRSSRR